MASHVIFYMGLAFALIGLPWARVEAQSGCNNVLMGTASCLNYVTGSSSTPSSSCCSQLANVVQSQPQCLCTVLKGNSSILGININQTLALALPGACNVKTPPISRCDAANGPSSSPVGSPEGMPAESPDVNPNFQISPSTSGSKTIPSSGYCNAAKVSLPMITAIVLMGSFASI